MTNTIKAVLAGAAILASATVAMAEPATPGDDLYNYGPTSQQAFRVPTYNATDAFASTRGPAVQRFAPVQQSNAWDAAREADALEGGHS